MDEIIKYLLSMLLFSTSFFITYKILYWFICFVLVLFNLDAVYNDNSRQTILKLSKTDKMWRDVAKVLELESEVN